MSLKIIPTHKYASHLLLYILFLGPEVLVLVSFLEDCVASDWHVISDWFRVLEYWIAGAVSTRFMASESVKRKCS